MALQLLVGNSSSATSASMATAACELASGSIEAAGAREGSTKGDTFFTPVHTKAVGVTFVGKIVVFSVFSKSSQICKGC